MVIAVFTDGSMVSEKKYRKIRAGGLSYLIVRRDSITEYSSGYYYTTINRMEFLAIILALESLHNPETIRVYTDSQAVIIAMTKGYYRWRKNNWLKGNGKKVKNLDLIFRLAKLMTFHNVTFSWVKAHSGVKFNDRCDQLARKAATRPTKYDKIFN